VYIVILRCFVIYRWCILSSVGELWQ